MKKIVLGMLLLAIVSISFQCNKKDDNANLKNPTVSKWTFNSKNFTAKDTKWYSEWRDAGLDLPALVAHDAASSWTIAAVFKTRPTSSGQYKVVGLVSNNNTGIGDGEVLFDLNDGNYWYFSIPGDTVDVKVVNNKIEIIYSDITGYAHDWTSSGILIEQ